MKLYFHGFCSKCPSAKPTMLKGFKGMLYCSDFYGPKSTLGLRKPTDRCCMMTGKATTTQVINKQSLSKIIGGKK